MPHGFEERGDLRFDARRTKGAGAMGSKHCVGSGGRVEPGQGCVGPEGPERLAQRARPSGSGWSEIAGIGSGAKGCQGLGS